MSTLLIATTQVEKPQLWLAQNMELEVLKQNLSISPQHQFTVFSLKPSDQTVKQGGLLNGIVLLQEEFNLDPAAPYQRHLKALKHAVWNEPVPALRIGSLRNSISSLQAELQLEELKWKEQLACEPKRPYFDP